MNARYSFIIHWSKVLNDFVSHIPLGFGTFKIWRKGCRVGLDWYISILVSATCIDHMCVFNNIGALDIGYISICQIRAKIHGYPHYFPDIHMWCLTSLQHVLFLPLCSRSNYWFNTNNLLCLFLCDLIAIEKILCYS